MKATKVFHVKVLGSLALTNRLNMDAYHFKRAYFCQHNFIDFCQTFYNDLLWVFHRDQQTKDNVRNSWDGLGFFETLGITSLLAVWKIHNLVLIARLNQEMLILSHFRSSKWYASLELPPKSCGFCFKWVIIQTLTITGSGFMAILRNTLKFINYSWMWCHPFRLYEKIWIIINYNTYGIHPWQN